MPLHIRGLLAHTKVSMPLHVQANLHGRCPHKCMRCMLHTHAYELCSATHGMPWVQACLWAGTRWNSRSVGACVLCTHICKHCQQFHPMAELASASKLARVSDAHKQLCVTKSCTLWSARPAARSEHALFHSSEQTLHPPAKRTQQHTLQPLTLQPLTLQSKPCSPLLSAPSSTCPPAPCCSCPPLPLPPAAFLCNATLGLQRLSPHHKAAPRLGSQAREGCGQCMVSPLKSMPATAAMAHARTCEPRDLGRRQRPHAPAHRCRCALRRAQGPAALRPRRVCRSRHRTLPLRSPPGGHLA